MINISTFLPARNQQPKSEFKSSWGEPSPQPAQHPPQRSYIAHEREPSNGPVQYIPSGPPSVVVEAEYLTGETQKLSAEQKLVLDLVLAGKSVFFTGAAGTGKSFVLKCLRQILVERGLIAQTYFTGTTGIAAINVGGCTLHSFAGIGLGNTAVEHLVGKVRNSRKASARWMNTKILVVDEISMLEADLFDKLAIIGSRIRSTDRPFGGIQLVLCGDFFQLPPVKRVNGEVQYAFDAQYWRQAIDFDIVLGQVYRQKDETFLQILNELRQGLVTPTAERVLLSKVSSRNSSFTPPLLTPPPPPKPAQKPQTPEVVIIDSDDENEIEVVEPVSEYQELLDSFQAQQQIRPTKLFSKNVDVDAMNQQELQTLEGPTYTYRAEDTGQPEHLNAIKSNCPAPEILELRLGAQVLLLKNLDLSRGLCNGSRGIIIGFTRIQDIGEVESPSDGDRSGHDIYPKVAFPIENGSCTVVHIFSEEWKVEEGAATLASRSQLPLRLAWAITIHKSQGMTISNLEVTFNGIFDYGQAYVALSRATGLEGLVLRDFNKGAVRAHPKVHGFYANLHQKMSSQSALLEASVAVAGQLSPDKINELASQRPKPQQPTTAQPTKKYGPVLNGSISAGRDGWTPKKGHSGNPSMDDWLSDSKPRMVTVSPPWTAKKAEPATVQPAVVEAKPALSDEVRQRIEQNRIAAIQRRKEKLEERQSQVAAVLEAAEQQEQAKRIKLDHH